MRSTPDSWRRGALALAFSSAVAMLPCSGPAAAAEGSAGYEAHMLVSNGGVPADHVDANLRNPWGVAFNPNGFVWISNNKTGTSTLYDGTGVANPLVVSVPAAVGGGIGSPTGIVFSGSADFNVGNGVLTGPSRFIFASEDGLISGWAPNVDGTHALPAVTTPGAIYKGIALAGNGSGNFIYATDFRNRRIDVFDRAFQPATTAGGFADPKIPRGYAPFGIQNIGGNLYVTYAKQDKEAEDDVTGRLRGFVNVFDADGRLLRRIGVREGLDAPWGVALAPANFGRYSHRLLVANFGDGTISAFDPRTGDYLGRLRRADGGVLRIPGLWGIQFGNGILGQRTDRLYFAAGPNDEQDGVYGHIAVVER